jgi:hypothetical protein
MLRHFKKGAPRPFHAALSPLSSHSSRSVPKFSEDPNRAILRHFNALSNGAPSAADHLQSIISHCTALFPPISLPSNLLFLALDLLSSELPVLRNLSLSLLSIATFSNPDCCDLLLSAELFERIDAIFAELSRQVQPSALSIVYHCIFERGWESGIPLEWVLGKYGVNDSLLFRRTWIECVSAFGPLEEEDCRSAVSLLCDAMEEAGYDSFLCAQACGAIGEVGICGSVFPRLSLMLEEFIQNSDDQRLVREAARLVGDCAKRGYFLKSFDLAEVASAIEEFGDLLTTRVLLYALEDCLDGRPDIADVFFTCDGAEMLAEVGHNSSFAVKKEIGSFAIGMFERYGVLGDVQGPEEGGTGNGQIGLFRWIFEVAREEPKGRLLNRLIGLLTRTAEESSAGAEFARALYAEIMGSLAGYPAATTENEQCPLVFGEELEAEGRVRFFS